MHSRSRPIAFKVKNNTVTIDVMTNLLPQLEPRITALVTIGYAGIGSWARDVISVEKENPNVTKGTMDYKELEFDLQED